MPLALPATNPPTINDVITLMQLIDAALPDNDGVKWFNRLYLQVTQAVDSQPNTFWQAPNWLTELDIIFAGMYFDALRVDANGGATPKSWQALLESRFTPRIDRIQFALAGMNAHINHDLAWALVGVNEKQGVRPGPTSSEHADFLKVNALLKVEIPQALSFLNTGAVGAVATGTGLVGRLLALWDVEAARNLAWDFSEQLQPMTPALRIAASEGQDQLTGVIGRALLLPIDPASINNPMAVGATI